MKTTTRTFPALLGIMAAGSLALGACSSGEDATSETSSMAPSSSASSSMESSESSESSDMESSESSDMSSDDSMAMGDLVGPGCKAYAEMVPDGAGSVEGMAMDPVATAASNNPMLTTLTKAVSGELNKDVNLVDTLNGDEFTVFAPVDDAFKAIPQDDLDALAKDKDQLTSVLTYHVVPGQIAPADIDGTHKTVQGGEVTVKGSGDDIMVNDASVVCGGVKTKNATVYLIDKVLMPDDAGM